MLVTIPKSKDRLGAERCGSFAGVWLPPATLLPVNGHQPLSWVPLGTRTIQEPPPVLFLPCLWNQRPRLKATSATCLVTLSPSVFLGIRAAGTKSVWMLLIQRAEVPWPELLPCPSSSRDPLSLANPPAKPQLVPWDRQCGRNQGRVPASELALLPSSANSVNLSSLNSWAGQPLPLWTWMRAAETLQTPATRWLSVSKVEDS